MPLLSEEILKILRRLTGVKIAATEDRRVVLEFASANLQLTILPDFPGSPGHFKGQFSPLGGLPNAETRKVIDEIAAIAANIRDASHPAGILFCVNNKFAIAPTRVFPLLSQVWESQNEEK